MKMKNFVTLAFAAATIQTQAEIYISPKIAMEYQHYDTEWVKGDYVAPTVGISIFTQSGIFLDAEYLHPSGDPDALEKPSRTEIALTAGKRYDSGFALFGGYKVSSTEGKDEYSGDWQIDFQGLFAGVSQSFTTTERSNIALSFAIASMATDVEHEIAQVQDEETSFEGDGLGFSGSAAFNYAFSSAGTASIGAKIQSYNCDEMDPENISSIFTKVGYRF